MLAQRAENLQRLNLRVAPGALTRAAVPLVAGKLPREHLHLLTSMNDAKLAWSRAIRPADYDAHMASVGQAEANAQLLAEFFARRPPATGARLLIAGAGTGQMFDFVKPCFLAPYRVTFADISADFLDVLRRRIAPATHLEYETRVDDLEHSALQPGYELAVVVLVLEHIDWRAGVATLCRLARSRVLTIVQENPPGVTTSMTRPPIGSMAVLREVPHALLDPRELIAEFQRHGFVLRERTARDVPDGKKMVLLEFVVHRGEPCSNSS